MKKKFLKVCSYILVIVFGLFLTSYDVNAKNYSSDFISITNTSYKYSDEELALSEVYFSKSASSSGGLTSYGVLFGRMINLSGYNLSADMTIDYYDVNYQLIARSTKTERPGVVSDNYFMNIILYDEDFLGNAKIDDIAYFKINYYTTKRNILSNESSITSLKPSQDSRYDQYDYVIDKYDINIIVNENNTFDITETITAYFNTSKHGIIRSIPLFNKLTRLNGTTSKNRTQISNLSVDNEYKISRENGSYKIKIGSAYKSITGEQTYVIKYTYNIGKDSIKDYDELYYNIIGTDWDTVIGNVSFNITMPKEFDSSKLGFSKGIAGSIDNDNIEYVVNGNKITGSYNGFLEAGEALTVRSELPEGYFVGAALAINFMDYIIFLIPLLFLGIAVFLWYKFGRDDTVVETVEFYPPEGFNSLEVGFLYKGKANNQDVTSLLIYLANKGYIKITEIEEKSLFSKSKGFKITKLKEYDGNNVNEKIFLNGLFTKQSHFDFSFDEHSEFNDNVNEVTLTDLYDNFYITMNRILSNINNKENKNKIFEKSASSKKIFIILMIIATFCLITIPPIFTYSDPGLLIFALLFPGIGFTVMFKMMFDDEQTIYINGEAKNSGIIVKLFALLWGALFGGMPWLAIVLPILLIDSVYLIGYFVGICCVIGMIICMKYLPKRTSYGNEILGKLRGFKNFLETAEKDRLEAMVMKNPTYFYDILPYTYVLGVSDKWIKKFESISLQAPTWYDSPSAFDVVVFSSFMNTTMASAQNAMSSSPSSSSGGSSSGGGSSGGGSGGGGGSSW